jgi:hypothetical protein
MSIVDWYHNHGTKILGFLSGLIAAVASVSDLIPQEHMKYYMGAIAVLTYLRGYENSRRAS